MRKLVNFWGTQLEKFNTQYLPNAEKVFFQDILYSSFQTVFSGIGLQAIVSDLTFKTHTKFTPQSVHKASTKIPTL